VTETVELLAGPTRVVVVPRIGGSIAAFEYDGQPILRPTLDSALDEGAVRSFACFPLIPFSNRIASARLRWAKRDYALKRFIDKEPAAIHGNGWQRQWSIAQQEPSRLSLELEHDALGARALEWPFPYRARQRFALDGDALGARLTLELDIENTGREGFPFGLGWHPYFPCDAGTELGFAAQGVWHTDPLRLPTRFGAAPPEWDFDAPRAIRATALDNCFAGWRPPATVTWPERRLTAEVAAGPECGFLVVFIPEGTRASKPFLAVEPVTHMTDAFNRHAENRDTGTRVLAPGASFSCTMSISVSRSA
jgi:aldose 1-epimerase